MFYLEKNCPVCVDGILGFFKCSDNDTIVVMCEECSSVWRSPDKVGSENLDAPQPPEYNLYESNIAIVGECSMWATYEEIKKGGYEKYASSNREYKP